MDIKDGRIEKLATVLRESLRGAKDVPHHKRHNDDDWFDEVRIETIPRYKTSGLSGNEWRTGVSVQLIRKGNVLYATRLRDIQTAAAWLAWGLQTVGETENIALPNSEYYCAQPGCGKALDVFYAISTLYNRGGTRAEYQYPAWRGFCNRHSQRGDSDMEDQDDNYQWFAGERPKRNTEDSPDASPSGFAGVIDLTECDDDSDC